MRLGLDLRNRLVDAMASQLSGGMLALYDGRPALKVSTTAWQDPLVVVMLESPAFGPSADGTATAPDLAPAPIQRTGEATWAQLLAADGSVLADLPVRTLDDPNAQPGDVLLDRTDCQQGGSCQLTRLTLTLPMQM